MYIGKNGLNEMAVHNKIEKSKEGFLFRHPLAEAYLHLKWQMINKYFYLNMLLYIFFLTSFTAFVVMQEQMFNCCDGPKKDGSPNCTAKNVSPKIKCGKFNKFEWNNETEPSKPSKALMLFIVDQYWWNEATYHFDKNLYRCYAILFIMFDVSSMIGNVVDTGCEE